MKKICFILLVLSIFCLNQTHAQTPGTEKWHFSAGDNIFDPPSIGSDGTIYVNCLNGKLFALQSNGTKVWECTVSASSSINGSAIGPDGTIYVGSYDNNVYAIYPNGYLKWSFDTGGGIPSTPTIDENGIVYIGSRSKKFFAINPDGSQRWSLTLGDFIEPSAAIGKDGTIYIGCNDDKLYAITKNGFIKWTYSTGGNIESSPSISESGIIYVGSNDNYLYALNSEGELQWKLNLGNDIYTTPVIGEDGTIYVGCNNSKLYAVNPGGSLKWTYSTGAYIIETPCVGADGTIYVGSTDDKLHAVNSNGSKQWTFTTGGNCGSPTISDDGTIYVGSVDDNIYAINSSSLGLAKSPWPKFHRDLKNTGKILALNVNCELDFYLINPGESFEKSFEITNPFSQQVTITDCKFDDPFITLKTALPVTINAGSSSRFYIDIQPNDVGLLTSNFQLTYEHEGETKQSSESITNGIFINDGSELAYEANQAISAYYDCTARDPNSISTQNNLGVLYHLLDEQDQALTLLNDAVSQSLNASYGYSGIQMNIGTVKSDQDQTEDAEDFYDYAIAGISESSSPIAPQVYFNKAWEAYKYQNYSQAEILLNQTTGHDMTNDFLMAKAYVLLGAIKFQQGDLTSAHSFFNLAIEKDPNGPIGQMARDNLLLKSAKIALLPGWNLVSWNIDTNNDSASVILNNIMNNVEVALGYEGQGLTFSPKLVSQSNLQTMDHHHGYWIKMKTLDTLVVFGNVIDHETETIQCEAGWNLVSYLPDVPDSVMHGFSSVMDNLETALGFDGEGLTYRPDLTQFSTLKILNPHSGYWIKISQDDELVYPEPLEGVQPTLGLGRKALTIDNELKKTAVYSVLMPTMEWINVYGENIKINGNLLPIGTVVRAVDSDGKLCGLSKVTKEGSFGFMQVYHDDMTSENDEGASSGDEISIYFDEYEFPEKVKWNCFGDVINLSKNLNELNDNEKKLPLDYGLSQNYPNPFNPDTKISYQLPEQAHVSIRIYNTMGQEVITLIDEKQDAGFYSVTWDARDSNGAKVSSGVYFYEIKSKEFSQTKKMMVLY